MAELDGWNMGSGEAFAAAFTEEGDLIVFDGTHFKGREEIAPFHQRLFETHLKGTRLVGQVNERPVPEARCRLDTRHRRNRDAREIKTFARARLNSDTRCYVTRRRMASRGVSEYEGRADGPQCFEYLAVYGLALESVQSKEMTGGEQ